MVVVGDKYALPSLTEEAVKSLTTFLTSIQDAAVLLTSLKILSDEFSNHSSLDECVTAHAKPRLKELVAVPGFPIWISSRSKLLQGLVEDAAALAALGNLKKINKYKCSSCDRVILDATQPTCCRGRTARFGVAYHT